MTIWCVGAEKNAARPEKQVNYTKALDQDVNHFVGIHVTLYYSGNSEQFNLIS